MELNFFSFLKIVCHFCFFILNNFGILWYIKWNSVITNSSGPAKSVRYNRVNLCNKCSFGTKISVRYNRVFVVTEFVITEFHCTIFFRMTKRVQGPKKYVGWPCLSYNMNFVFNWILKSFVFIFSVVEWLVLNNLFIVNLIVFSYLCSVIDWLSPKNDGLFGGDRLDIMKSAANGELSSESCHKYKCEQPISHDFVANKKE